MAFFISSSPHAHIQRRTSELMIWVMLCTSLGLIAQTFFFGFGSLIQVAFAMMLAVLAESLVLLLRKKPLKPYLSDNSALLTGLLIGLAIPPLAPWWITVIGVVSAIVVAKHLYGGIGQNLFNPAMVAYVVLLISFPLEMTSWLPPQELLAEKVSFIDSFMMIFTGHSVEGFSIFQLQTNIDGVTMATPLDAIKTSLKTGLTTQEIYQQPIFDSLAGVGWQWINLGYFIGGIVLLKQRVIQWQIPISFLGSLFCISFLFYLFNPDTAASPLIHLFSGATMLGAFFIATDPVSAATTPKGRIVYGAAIGLLIYLIRSWGGFPDGIAFAVLITNMCVPLIDYYTKPRTYGHVKG